MIDSDVFHYEWWKQTNKKKQIWKISDDHNVDDDNSNDSGSSSDNNSHGDDEL